MGMRKMTPEENLLVKETGEVRSGVRGEGESVEDAFKRIMGWGEPRFEKVMALECTSDIVYIGEGEWKEWVVVEWEMRISIRKRAVMYVMFSDPSHHQTIAASFHAVSDIEAIKYAHKVEARWKIPEWGLEKTVGGKRQMVFNRSSNGPA